MKVSTHSAMDNYEEFCLRSLAKLQSEGQGERMCSNSPTPGQWLKSSAICIHGKTILSPRLTEEQRREMCVYRQRAAEKEAEREVLCRSSLLTQVQNILDNAQKRKVLQPSKAPNSPVNHNPQTELQLRSFPQGSDQQCLPISRVVVTDTAPAHQVEPFALRLREVEVRTEEEEQEEEEEDDEEEVEMEEDSMGGEVSLQSLLRKSREYMEREQGRGPGSKVDCNSASGANATRPVAAVANESLSDKENDNGSPVAETASQRQSPVSSAAAATASPVQRQCQDESVPAVGPRGPAESVPSGPWARLCQPEPSLSPSPTPTLRPHRGRPRPVSTGDLLFSFPAAADIAASRPKDIGIASWLAMDQRSPDHASSASWVAGSRRASNTVPSPVGEAEGVVGGPNPPGPEGFRRRCHTLDSQFGVAPIDRSQERLPRFMAGVAQRPSARRSPPGPPYPGHGQESPVPALLRNHPVTPDPVTSQVRLRLDSESDHESRRTPSLLSTPVEDKRTDAVDAVQWRVQALEEEHAFQLSLLLAEQEREQQRLRQELVGTERRVSGVCPSEPGGEWGSVRGEHYPASSPCSSLSPGTAERSPPHSTYSMGFPSPLSPSVATPSTPPTYPWGTARGGNKSRSRFSQVLSVDQQRVLCRLTAVVRGFLIRRLLKTDKVKHLRQTVQDTQEFIRSFQTEAPQRRASLSPQDLSLQDRVRAQLRAALFDIHDIFFELSPEERLALLQQDRELRTERKLREMEKSKPPKERRCLSAATQKSLDRKKQRVGESPGPVRKTQQKPKSPSTNRILLPSQGQNSPVPSQLLRQGSWYKKTPEHRVKRSDSLKKQHSLG
ncbi:centriolar coiled-coil protein of 110 kDa-like isoform X2 [Sardina pilchardus]|uniref:centriolar coiled-coil protein of 110 kDa-like isoform X2 n=1 Tax=Sardina pilchardus TaxID=27697 RepID=UPI002E0D32D4